MDDGSVTILTASDVQELLAGRELDLIDVVRKAYEAHALRETSLPHSTFLHFPGDQRSRIIALPAYLGSEFGVAGIKWISSFPANLDQGLDRASAVVVLNSTRTGRPEAILEGSIISAKRTAASAALAARSLSGDSIDCIGMVGSGLINFEVTRFLVAAYPDVKTFVVFDIQESRANLFRDKCQTEFKGISFEVATDIRDVLGRCLLVTMATTASRPYISDLSECAPGSVILHLSLRDLAPEVIQSCDNVVDDIDHVCRAETSIHLTSKLLGHTEFIRCTLGDVLLKTAPARNESKVTVFSPFGLGILDLAVSKYVLNRTLLTNSGAGNGSELGTVIRSFLPDSWTERGRSGMPPTIN